MDMGDRIKQLRKEKDMTQEELGKLVGVKKAAVQKWESGQVKNLKKSTIKKLSEIFGVLPSYLMGMDDIMEESEKIIKMEDFIDPIEAMKFILEQPALMAYGGYDLEMMSDEEIIEIANDLLYALRISAERHKRKKD